MDFLKKIPPQLRNKVEDILGNNDMPFVEKFKFLRNTINDSSIVYQAVDCLKQGKFVPRSKPKMEPKIEEDPCSPDDFLKLVTAAKRKLMELQLEKGHIEALEKLVFKSEENVQKAYTKWRDWEKAEKLRQSPQIDTGLIESLPECTNILLLGQTGVGKSTFINGLANYLKYSTPDYALKLGIQVLIRTYFTHNDEKECRRIECLPNIEEHRSDAENEHTVAGQSSTQSAKTYTFSIGSDNNKKRLRIIDTPGVGDVRGIEQDGHNLTSIISTITEFKEIHAVCVLLKPNENKLTLTFRYCLDEIFSNLPASAIKNVLFCFTNSRQSFYRPGDTSSTIDAYLTEIKAKRKLDIPLNKSTMFCFDNESYRFLCAMREGVKFDKLSVETFTSSWDRTAAEIFRMIRVISELSLLPVKDILAIANFRNALRILQRPLVQISHNLYVNGLVNKDKRKEVEELTKRLKELQNSLHQKQYIHKKKAIQHPIMVCTSKQCVEHKRFTPDGPMETIYKSECHPNCTEVIGVRELTCPSPGLAQCFKLLDDSNKCSVCNCHWSTHMHIRYKIETSLQDEVNPVVKNQIDEINTKLSLLNFHVRDNHNKSNWENQATKVKRSCVDVAAFLQKNSIKAYNEAYREYVEHLIREQKALLNQKLTNTPLEKLEQFRDENEEQVKLFKESGFTTSKSADEIYKLIKNIHER